MFDLTPHKEIKLSKTKRPQKPGAMLKADEIESNDCDCDVLEINDPHGSIGNQNFTRQNGTYNEEPYYVSGQWNMISWNNHHWSYDTSNTYNSNFKIIESNKIHSTNFYSFEHMCKNVTRKVFGNERERFVKSRCLRDNLLRSRNCSAINELIRINQGIHEKLQPSVPCKFPFIYRNVTYNSCTKKDYNKIWCATTVNATNHETSFGICNALCPREDFVIKPDEVVVKSLDFKLEVGISVGVFLILAFIIGCICIKKKKMITQESGKYYYSTLLNNHTCIRIFHLGMHLFTVRIYKNLII